MLLLTRIFSSVVSILFILPGCYVPTVGTGQPKRNSHTALKQETLSGDQYSTHTLAVLEKRNPRTSRPTRINRRLLLPCHPGIVAYDRHSPLSGVRLSWYGIRMFPSPIWRKNQPRCVYSHRTRVGCIPLLDGSSKEPTVPDKEPVWLAVCRVQL